MEHGPTDMIVRYKNLATSEKRRLEQDEDKLLVTVLYNMSAFMIMMDVQPNIIRRKVRRMLGKSHIGLQQDKEIQKLLGNGINCQMKMFLYQGSNSNRRHQSEWCIFRKAAFSFDAFKKCGILISSFF